MRKRILGLITIFAAGCVELRETEDQATTFIPAITYVDDIQPLLSNKCVMCHSGGSAEGMYDLSTWSGLVRPGSNLSQLNLIPGSAESNLIVTVDPVRSGPHFGLLTAEEYQLLEQWIVDNQAAYFRSTSHNPDWLYPADRNNLSFHGGELRANQWNTVPCQSCHGEDLAGGTSEKSCLTCHESGVDGCNTCHGSDSNSAPPGDLSHNFSADAVTIGLHQTHLASDTFRPELPCSTCHVVPETVDAQGHTDGDFVAEVVFDDLANGTVRGFPRDVTWNRDAATCTNSYCHSLDGGKAAEWRWTAPVSDEIGCDSCHGMPPTKLSDGNDHPAGEACTLCHGTYDKARHINGAVELRADVDTCYGCHGTEASQGAPPPDVAGNTSTSALAVGFHRIHLEDGAIAGAIPCTRCHVVPTNEERFSHIDHGPATITFDGFVKGQTRFRELNADWSRDTATCTNVYCHAPSGQLPDGSNLAGGAITDWVWNQKPAGGVACDSCHSMPPPSPHPQNPDCFSCHGPFDTTTHVNGIVELPAGP